MLCLPLCAHSSPFLDFPRFAGLIGQTVTKERSINMNYLLLCAAIGFAPAVAATCPADLKTAFGGKTFVGTMTESASTGVLQYEALYSIQFFSGGRKGTAKGWGYAVNAPLSDPSSSQYDVTLSNFVRQTCSAKLQGSIGGNLVGIGTLIITPGVVSLVGSSSYGSVFRAEMREP